MKTVQVHLIIGTTLEMQLGHLKMKQYKSFQKLTEKLIISSQSDLVSFQTSSKVVYILKAL